jgi:hypothetical protein
MSDKELTEAVKELKDEIRRAMYIYVAFWTAGAVTLFVILTKMAGAW